MSSTAKPVGVDKDAVPSSDPVTIVVSPAGNEYEAGSWSEANNYMSMTGYEVKDGHPANPVEAAQMTDKNGKKNASASAGTATPSAPSA